MHIQCIDSMASPSKRRLEPKKRPDTLIEALDSLNLDGDDDESVKLQEEIKRRDNGFAPEPDALDPRYENERFTVVFDDSLRDWPGRDVQSRQGDLHVFKQALLRQFPNAILVPLSRFQKTLDEETTSSLDVRTLFVAFEWDFGAADPIGHYVTSLHREMAAAMHKYQAMINVPLQSEHHGTWSHAVLLDVMFTKRPSMVDEWYAVIKDRPWFAKRRGFAYHSFFTGEPDSNFIVDVYPFFVAKEEVPHSRHVNRWTIKSLFRYFHDSLHYHTPKNGPLAPKEIHTANNAARALQEIISVGLATSLPKTLGIEPSQPWDHVALDQDTRDATVDFVRRDPIYDPRLFLLIWAFVYEKK